VKRWKNSFHEHARWARGERKIIGKNREIFRRGIHGGKIGVRREKKEMRRGGATGMKGLVGKRGGEG